MKVNIPYELHDKIMFFVDKSSIEISMMARIKKEKDTFTLTNVYLLEQENTSTTTDIDADALGKLMYTSREDEGYLNCWIHSHVNMGVFWSGTDRDTMQEFGANGFLLSLVFNKKGEINCSYFQGEQGADSPLPWLVVDDVPVTISYPAVKGKEDWEAEYKDKCRTKTYKQPTYSTGKHQPITLLNNNSGGKNIGNNNKQQTVCTTEKDIGDINPKNLKQRWHVDNFGKGRWTGYKRFVQCNSWYDAINILDQQEGARVAWIKIFEREKNRLPVDDYEINDYYMDAKSMSPIEFYEEMA